MEGTIKVTKKTKNFLNHFLDRIERIGNKMPDPFTMFLGLSGIVIAISAICSAAGVSAVSPADGSTVYVKNLFSAEGLQYLWENVVTNYAGFAPLGMVLVALVGSSAAEKSGFLYCLMERFLGGAKEWVVTIALIFIAINLNVIGDAAYIILPPLGAILYRSIGRSPLLGLYVSFASVSAGMCANIWLGLADALAYGFTEPAAKMVDPNYSGSMAINWYYLFVSTFVLTIAGSILVEKVLVPRFAKTKQEVLQQNFNEKRAGITLIQRKGLRRAGVALLIYAGVILLLSLPAFGSKAILANEAGSITAGNAPFTKGIVFTVSLALLIPGIVYGAVIGKYKRPKDVWADITEGFSEMGNYIFMCFFISIFTNFFSESNLGTILAVKGASGLKSIGLSGIPLLIGLLIFSGIINIFMGSASAKWAIFAPVFVPMMMMMGFDPAVTQLVYRMGDSLTDPISPLFTYMPAMLGFVRKYDKKAGLGTLIANMTPFTITYAIVWIIQLIIWTVLNLPLGPGGFIYRQ